MMFSDNPNLKPTVVDWDISRGREAATASVGELPVSSLSTLAGTDVGRALAAAGIDFGEELSTAPQQTHADPGHLSRDALIAIVTNLQRRLYTDDAGELCWNIEKEWATSDICMELACLPEQHGLTP